MMFCARRRCRPSAFLGLALAAALAGPAAANPRLPGATRAVAPTFSEDQALQQAVGGRWRPAMDVARDGFRHPYESLQFWGLRPGMTVVDLQPGGGYWTAILAPYAKATHGRYIAGVADLADPKVSDGARKDRAAFEAKFADRAVYGAIEPVGFGPASGAIAPPASVDLVLTARELHNWLRAGRTDRYMAAAFAALKPGGVLAVEDHRADPRPETPGWTDGYVAAATVVAAAGKAGFVFEGGSEVNANPKDTKDHPFGVWTLPPTRQSSGSGAPDPAFDHAKYDAIGESDRFTLRFRKPG